MEYVYAAMPLFGTLDEHLVDPFHSLDNLKNQFASVAFCKNSEVCNVWNGSVIALPIVISINGFPHHWRLIV